LLSIKTVQALKQRVKVNINNWIRSKFILEFIKKAKKRIICQKADDSKQIMKKLLFL